MRRVRRIRLTSTVIAVLMVALLGLGFGYAAWTDQLTVHATASTGSMSTRWLNGALDIRCDEIDVVPVGYASIEGYRDDDDDQLAHFVINDGYPGYVAECDFKWENHGTVPVKVQTIDINGVSVGSGVPVFLNIGGTSAPDLKVQFFHGIGAPYEPTWTGGATLRVEILGDAPQGATLEFTAHVNLVQHTP